MQELTPRNIDILRLIIEEYLNSGELVGSQKLLKKYDLGVSPATVRNDMAKLEEYELIFQPYNSAGRFPTSKGLRVFINHMMKARPDYFIAPVNQNLFNYDGNASLENKIHSIVYNLANATKEIAFLVIPEEGISRYAGVPHFIEKNQKAFGENVLNIIKILEEKNSFIAFIKSLGASEQVSVFVGEENMIAYLKDFSIIIKKINLSGKTGYVGLIGSLRMDYSFNISAIRGIV
ncbi:MAG: DeoR family transcriptional regulator [Candidatus Gracilibacteria bacterium]|nr:DeoR family transcriptional regulator [Candidatus Gracilibacteria bacterium]